jgi:hypothetical protein
LRRNAANFFIVPSRAVLSQPAFFTRSREEREKIVFNAIVNDGSTTAWTNGHAP